jgi:hypothetical protein
MSLNLHEILLAAALRSSSLTNGHTSLLAAATLSTAGDPFSPFPV